MKRGLQFSVGDAMASTDEENSGKPDEAPPKNSRYKRKKNSEEDEIVCFLNSENLMLENIAESTVPNANNNTTTISNETTVSETTANAGGWLNKDDARKETVLYPTNHKGKASVLFDTSAAENVQNKRVRNGLYLWGKIKDYNIDGIDEIKAIGITLYRVTFENVLYANRCVQNEILQSSKIKTFIPKNYVETYGVIRGIPIEYSDAEIKECIISEVKITSIQRLTRRENRDSVTRVPTWSVKIGFSGDKIPKSVVLNHTILEVQYFIPIIRQCYKCGRLGHTQKACKSEKRCLKCGNREECTVRCDSLKCILCGNLSHIALDRKNCPAWEKENQLIKIMTLKKQTRREVLNDFKTESANRFELLSEEHFPELKRQQNPFKDNQVELNKILTPASYARVVRRHIPNSISPAKTREIKPPRQSRGHSKEQNNGVAFKHPNLHIVTEIEKITSEMTKFARDAFRKVNFPAGVNAFVHFNDRLKQKFLSLDSGEMETGEGEEAEPQNESFTV